MSLEENVILIFLKYVIAVLGLGLVATWLMAYRRFKDSAYRVIFLIKAFVGAYWTFYYVQSITGGFVLAHQVWVRAGILVTLAASIAIGIAFLRERPK